MVRRVGFGDGEQREQRAHVAARRMRDKPPATPSAKPDAAPGPPKKSLLSRLLLGMFLTVWITAWSGAIAMAVGMLLDVLDAGEGDGAVWFLAFWIGVAVIAWGFALRVLIRLIATGQVATRAELSGRPDI